MKNTFQSLFLLAALSALAAACKDSGGGGFTPGCQSDLNCNDGNPCTIDTCTSERECAYQAVSVDDGIACTADSCNTTSGSVTHTPNHGACAEVDGYTCTIPQCDTVLGCMEYSEDAGCMPSNACVAFATCEPGVGDPVTGCVDVPFNTDDGVNCTVDSCDPTDGNISHIPDDTACSDADGFTCTVPTCDLNLDCIEVPNHSACDDGVDCTADACAASTGCSNTPDDNACDPTYYCHSFYDCRPRETLAAAIITEIMLGAGEFVEIHNPGANDADMSCPASPLCSFTLASSTLIAAVRAAGDPTGADNAPVIVPAGGFVYGVPNPADPADIPAGAAFVYGAPGFAGLLNPSGDTLALNSPGPVVLDDVDFTSLHTDPDTAIAASAFPSRAGASTQLDAAFLDTTDNDDGANWCIPFRVAHTAGLPNQSCAPTTVVINELLYDGALGADTADARKTFIELSGPGGARIADLRIRFVETDGAGAGNLDGPNILIGSLLPNARLRTDGFFVLADNNGGDNQTVPANERDVQALFDPENGSQAVQLLLDDAGALSLVDALAYVFASTELDVTVDNVNGLAIVETAPAIDVNQQISLARDLASTDTNDNSVDFVADPSPSPGVANEPVNTTVTSVTPDNALASVATPGVVIAGTDIAFNAAVMLAGVAIPTAQCSYANITTQIVCTAQVSPAALRGDVVVQNPVDRGGTSGTLASGWTYTGVLNETDLAGEADFCNLQFPPATTVQTGQNTELIYGRVYEAGLTEPGGADPTVIAELGYGPTATDPTVTAGWSFVAATFNTQVGNDDEYQASLVAPAAGTYAYTYRVSFDGGINFTYCDLDGAGSNSGLDFDPAQLGVMTVTP